MAKDVTKNLKDTEKNNNSIFDEYKDLYKLTSKTVDEHIEFYKNKKSLSYDDLFTVWRKLSKQATSFDERKWYENWHNWHKNIHAFEGHKFEAKFLIQNYLTDVLEEVVGRLIENCTHLTKALNEKIKSSQEIDDDLSQLIRKEVKLQVKEELAKRKTKKK